MRFVFRMSARYKLASHQFFMPQRVLKTDRRLCRQPILTGLCHLLIGRIALQCN